ncbi:MAG TPA: histidine phosphatase family protein, partial [bacterium]|nr:histidine phosphatase family protein [bacterium]
MNVYLIRHAAAAEAVQGEPDEQRALTQEGVSSVKACLPAMEKLIGVPDYMLTSPARRAVQTA